ncbi:MAG: hypothetical protein GXX96_15455 [Planctomycetaceae bacterium]|nr:hypothetical protein [Planctomycetaceae bacterium]
MIATFEKRGIGLLVRDVSGQKKVEVRNVPVDSTIGEVVQGSLPKMGLPNTDVEGRPLNYHARLEREGRHLHASESVGDALRDDDQLVLQPNIQAGGRSS